MTTIRKFYEQHVETQWPKQLPKLTATEADRAARRLYRFVFKRACPYPVKLTSGRNHSYIRGRALRVNPDNGWDTLVHGLSHSFYSRLHPGAKPHSGQHGSLERHMIRHIVDSGWLDGKLAPKLKADKPAADPKLVKYRRTLASIARWQAKIKRANTAMKKLAARKRYYERQGIAA